MEELVAVLDAVGSEKPAVVGVFDGGPTAMLFAATKPERCRALILANTSARYSRDDDYPPDMIDQVGMLFEQMWGTEEGARALVPSRAHDEHLIRWFARLQRNIASPTSVRAFFDVSLKVDARAMLPAIGVPTLVLHRADYGMLPLDHGRYLADNIPGAKLVVVPGSDGPLSWENPDVFVDSIEEFLTGMRRGGRPNRVLASLLFSDIVDSTERVRAVGDESWRELLEAYLKSGLRIVEAFQGRLVDTAGDGIFATFDGPGRAIRAAVALRFEVDRLGLQLRSGVHTGEVELRDEGVGGISVHIAARVMGHAGDGEVLVSRTVKDLIAGSDVVLEDRGTHLLKGVEGDWELFAVVSA